MTDLDSLSKQYKLKKEDVGKKISDIHLDKISHSCCSQWKRLPPYLDMERISEDEKRSSFFSKWVDEKGSDATYGKLISALLKMECKNDAEKVCELIQPVLTTPPKLSQSPQPASAPELPKLPPDHRPEHEPGPKLPQLPPDHRPEHEPGPKLPQLPPDHRPEHEPGPELPPDHRPEHEPGPELPKLPPDHRPEHEPGPQLRQPTSDHTSPPGKTT